MDIPTHRRCTKCRFAKRDAAASDKDWTAYACTNRKSEYFGALLNVRRNGDKLYRITWTGCPLWEGSDEE